MKIELLLPLATLVFSIIGYFIKQVHSDLKRVREDLTALKNDTGKLHSKISLVDQKTDFKYSQIEQITQNEIKHLSEQVEELAKQVRALVDWHINSRNERVTK